MLREPQWDKNVQLLLVAIIAFNVLPHVSSIPVWSTALAGLFLIWKTLALLRGVARPPRWFLWGVSFVCMIGVFFEYKTILGQEPAAAILVTLASAKLLETNRYRDAMFVIFTSFFLLMAHLLDSQSILTTIFMAADVMLITALMFQLHKQERRKSARSFRPVMKTLGLAIPVWIFLFLAFPRFSAGFGGTNDPNQGSGGFAEDLDPGGIEQLVESEETAFRVRFNGAVPNMEQLYWRGAILTESDGLVWKKPKERGINNDVLIPAKPIKTAFEYQTFLEPRFSRWVFALDYPESVTFSQVKNAFRKRPGFIYENLRPNSSIVQYEGSSQIESSPQRLLNEDRETYLRLPDSLDPRIQELASDFKRLALKAPNSARLPTVADRIGDEAINWFIAQQFRYTKSPGGLRGSGGDQLAQFLFETKRGFCEHYSASFATLMRAAGVPARVTVGFLGATRNVYSDYFIVRDLDAHAWAEIWREDALKPGTGRWVRVDPTGFIAPLRLQMGGEFNLLDPSSYAAGLSQAQAQIGLRNGKLIARMRFAWDAMQMRYNAFLTDFDFDFQKSILENFGLKNVSRFTLFGIAASGILLFVAIFMLVLRKRAHRRDPVRDAWSKFCRKVERAGLSRRSNEGPLDFTSRAAQALPAKAELLKQLGLRYAELRYGAAAPDALSNFKREVRLLKLTKT